MEKIEHLTSQTLSIVKKVAEKILMANLNFIKEM